MSVTETSIIQPGTRVEVRRGRFPSDPTLIGRAGVVVWSSQYEPSKVQVTLDGESVIRVFAPDELAVTSAPAQLPPDVQAARKRLARP